MSDVELVTLGTSMENHPLYKFTNSAKIGRLVIMIYPHIFHFSPPSRIEMANVCSFSSSQSLITDFSPFDRVLSQVVF